MTAQPTTQSTSKPDSHKLLDAWEAYWNKTAALAFRMSHKTVEATASQNQIVDEQGNTYLDFAGSYGVFIVGHGHPSIRKAMKKQLHSLATQPATLDSESSTQFKRQLLSVLPNSMSDVCYANSGAEAAEMAMRIALATRAGRTKFIVAQDSYHGKTLAALNLLGQVNHRIPFEPLMSNVIRVPYGDLAAIKNAIDKDVAAVFLEPVLGGPFIQVPPAGYLRSVQSLCRGNGSLFVVDEIQTAFGRSGNLFEIDEEKLEPDLLLLSKGLTGGHAAIAVMAMHKQVVDRIKIIPNFKETYLTSQVAGQPITCAVASASLNVITQDNLPARSKKMGKLLINGLKRIASRYPELILDVPGKALMTGLKCRNYGVETAIMIAMGKEKIHLGYSLNESATHPVLRFYPSLYVTEVDIQNVLVALERVMEKLSKKPRWLFSLFTHFLRIQYRLPNFLLNKMSGK